MPGAAGTVGTWRVGLAPGAAREHVRVARAVGALPLSTRRALPGWMGERLDVAWAIGVLHPLARQGHGQKGEAS